MGTGLEVILFLIALAAVVVAARLYAIRRRESREKDLLFDVGMRISATLEQDEVLNLILDGLQEVVGYDAAAIFLVDSESGEIDYHIVRGYEERHLDKVKLKVGEGLVGVAAESEEPVIANDVRMDPRYVNARPATRSEITIPLSVAGEVIAVLNLESDRVRAYRSRDLKLLQTFGSQAAVAIENASCYYDTKERRVLEEELEIAGEIQHALLPHSPPEVPGLDIAAQIQPSHSVGGDLYDLVPLGEGRLGVAIGDISGKGAPAAILMASLYASFRSLTRRALTLPDIMVQLNNLICENFRIERFATFFYGVINMNEMEMTYSNAGHFAPLLIRPGEKPEQLSNGGIVLGYMPDSEYGERTVKLQPDDLLVLYTDGIIETEDPSGEMFGEERLVDIAATLIGQSASDVLEGLWDAVRNHCVNCAQADDITLVVIRVL